MRKAPFLNLLCFLSLSSTKVMGKLTFIFFHYLVQKLGKINTFLINRCVFGETRWEELKLVTLCQSKWLCTFIFLNYYSLTLKEINRQWSYTETLSRQNPFVWSSFCYFNLIKALFMWIMVSTRQFCLSN